MGNEVDIKVTASGGAKAAAEIDRAKGSAQNFQHSISGIGATARGLLAADVITDIGATAKESFSSAITAASDLNESLNAVDRIFGQSADMIHQWGQQNANAFGLSERAFNQLVTPLGAGLRNAGFDMERTSELTLKLTERAADMASVFNTSVPDALQAVQAALRGEADPIERYGVSVMDAAVVSEALAESGKKVSTELTVQDKALARVNLILKQTNSVAGDFKNTSDGLANSQRIAAAEIEEAKAKLGQGLLPVLAEGAKLISEVADGFGRLPGPLQTGVAVVLGLGAAFVFLAPKILAVRDLLKDMDTSWLKSDTRMANATIAVGKFAGRLAVLATAAQVTGMAFGSDLNPQIEEFAENLAEFGQRGKASGEAARLMGEDFDKLNSSITAVGRPGTWDDIQRGTAKALEGLFNAGDLVDDTYKHAEDRVHALDAALASLVSNGRADEAAAAFKRVAEAAEKNGVSTEDLMRILPQYAAAQAKAGRQTNETSKEMEGQVIALDDLQKALRAQTDPLFGLIEAQHKLSDAQKEYTAAVKKHGPQSEEAKEAMRTLAEAAIGLAGATADAQGVFNGKLTPALRQILIQAGATDKMIAQLEQQFRDATAAGDAFAKNYNATITVTTHGAKTKQQRVDDAIDRLTGGRASGGPGSGQMVVGEHGRPEIVDFDRHLVYSPSQTQQMLGGSGGFGSGIAQVEVTVVHDVRGAYAEMVQLVKSMVDREGAGSVVRAFSRPQYQN